MRLHFCSAEPRSASETRRWFIIIKHHCVCVCLCVRVAYVVYEDSSAMHAAFDKLNADPPSLAGKQLRLMKYDPSVEWPTGSTETMTLSQ